METSSSLTQTTCLGAGRSADAKWRQESKNPRWQSDVQAGDNADARDLEVRRKDLETRERWSKTGGTRDQDGECRIAALADPQCALHWKQQLEGEGAAHQESEPKGVDGLTSCLSMSCRDKRRTEWVEGSPQ